VHFEFRARILKVDIGIKEFSACDLSVFGSFEKWSRVGVLVLDDINVGDLFVDVILDPFQAVERFESFSYRGQFWELAHDGSVL
jgi:hypothetical protein